MRRLIVLIFALAMMQGLSTLQIDGDLGSGDPLTLAAIGFTILAAYSIGELGTNIGLPKVTGYILAGIVLGPQVGAVLSGRVVGDMGMFKNLALGLIATTAGLELNLKAIVAVWRTLVATVALKIPLLMLLVGGVTVGIQHFHPFFAIEGMQANIAFALILSILGIGTSPAIALAVVSDSKSKGRLTDILLGIAVVKDLVVVVTLAIGIALANALLTPDASMDIHVLVHVAEELFFSIVVGLAVGGIFIAYIRYIHQEMLLFVLVMVLLMIEVTSLLHLELLLVFIAGGFLVRNFSPYEHELLDPLERVSLPIFVVFFTVAGAEVQLETTWRILPMALALVAARALAFWISANLGSLVGGEGPAIRKNAWLTYLPQAGVTLGLVFMAAEKIEPLAAPLTEMGMALVALHLLVGPVTTGLGLAAAGEVGKGGHDHGAHATDAEDAEGEAHSDAQVAAPASEVEIDEPVPLLSPASIAAPITQTEVADVVEKLGETLIQQLETFSQAFTAPAAQALLELLSKVLVEDVSRLRRLRLLGKELSPSQEVGDAPGGWAGCGDALYRDLAERVQNLPISLSVPQDAATLYSPPGEGFRLQLAKSINRMAFRMGIKKKRHLALRLAGRVCLEPVLANRAMIVEASWYRTRGYVLEILGDVVEEHISPEDALVKGRRMLGQWQTELGLELRRGVQEGLVELAGVVSLLGTPAYPNSSLRYSTVEPKVHGALTRLERQSKLWPQKLRGAEENIQASVQVELAALKVHGTLKERGHDPLDHMENTLAPLIKELKVKLDGLREVATQQAILDVKTMQELSHTTQLAYTRSNQISLRRARSRFRRMSQPSRLLMDLTSLSNSLPKTLHLIAQRTPLKDAKRPEGVITWTIPIAEQIETTYFEHLVPGFSAALQRASELISTSHGRLEACIQPATYALELAQRGALDDEKSRTQAIQGAFERASQRLADLDEELRASVAEAHTDLDTLFDATVKDLRGDLLDDARAAATRVEESVRLTGRWARSIVARVSQSFRQKGKELGDAARKLANQKALRDLRISSGQEVLDAVGIRTYLDRWLTHPFDLPLPPVYTRLFSIKTIDDRRFLVAHRHETHKALSIINAPEGSAYAGSVLIVGQHGSGRSSFLNSLQLRLGRSRILRMDDTFASREEGLVAALAAELSTTADPMSIVAKLEERPTDVLIDNLERWLLPTPQGLSDLEMLARIMVKGNAETRWVVTIEKNALASLSPLVPLRRIFTHTVELAPLDWRELMDVVDTRDRLGGFHCHFEGSRPWSLASLLGREKEFYFRHLAKVSEGNLRAALLAHLRALSTLEEGILRVGAPSPLALPFLGQLTAEALATLSLIARYGPMSSSELSLALLLPGKRVLRTVSYLSSAGLLEPTGPGGAKVRVPPHIGPALFMELGHSHALLEEGVSL